ncbi:MAG: hypothetical protein IPM24_18685 [Bryobacterales bacterium]|nr:hypothetical protein [Bryobacterales bacterium]
MKQFVLASLLVWGVPLGAATIEVSPGSANATIGSTIIVDVLIQSVADLYAHQFDLSFDPSVLSATLVSPGQFLSGGVGFLPGEIDNVAGTVVFTADTLSGPDPGVSGSGTLASIQFTGLAPGVSALVLSNVILLDSNLADIELDAVNGGSVRVGDATVPEPAQGVPMIVALIAFLVRRRVRGTIRGGTPT